MALLYSYFYVNMKTSDIKFFNHGELENTENICICYALKA